MSLVFRIAYVAYGKGTHHKLALDALNRLAGSDADGWRRLFLKHAEVYAASSKYPDDRFKDFKNHVLHPRDSYWGGAPLACRQWYGTFVTELKAGRWSEAVGAAGVLSHYLADPLHPFHTAQSDAENTIHRACEWSINRAYDGLYAEGCTAHAEFVRRPMRDPNWLARLVCESADLSNVHYEKLIAHYDIGRGVSDPPSGLDALARRISAEMLVLAAATIAAVLDRGFEDAGVKPPAVSLTAASLLAAVKIPANQILKKIADGAERKQVQAIYDELRATGTVVANLPEENRAIRDLYAKEVAALKPKADAVALFPLPAPETPYALPGKHAAHAAEAAATASATSTTTAAATTTVAPRPANGVNAGAGSTAARRRLSPTDDVVDAPSIGPKTAARLKAHNINTVGDLLTAKPGDLAAALAQRHITASVITDWQDQAHLVLELTGLTGTQAQLLVGAGYRNRQAITAAGAAKLCTDVAAFAATHEGRRILHDGKPPEAAHIAAWHAMARSAEAA